MSVIGIRRNFRIFARTPTATGSTGYQPRDRMLTGMTFAVSTSPHQKPNPEGRPAVWIWGKLSIVFLRQHIAREVQPACVAHGYGREEAIDAMCAKLRTHFDAAWPVETQN